MTQEASLADTPSPCPHCGYDLRATGLYKPCPECGHRRRTPCLGVRVEHGRIIVRSVAELPPRCIWTNEPVCDTPVVRDLVRIPPVLLTLLIIFRPLGLLFYYLLRRGTPAKSCVVTYYISQRVRRKRLIRRVIGLTLIVVALSGVIVGQRNAIPAMTLSSILIAIAALAVLISTLRALRAYHFGQGEFQLRGCCKAFVEQLREDVGVVQAASFNEFAQQAERMRGAARS